MGSLAEFFLILHQIEGTPPVWASEMEDDDTECEGIEVQMFDYDALVELCITRGVQPR